MAVLLVAAGTSGCTWFGGNGEDETQQAKDLYSRAKNSLRSRNYSAALENYRQLEESFPFNRYAQYATIERAYAHYKSHQYDEAIALLDRFITLYPNHPEIDYVYYLKGLCHYNYGRGPLDWILERDRTDKDPKPMEDAFSTFNVLWRNYPDSPYRNDAWLRIVALRNMLAVHEIRIADYYLRRRAYLAVINRCKYILEHYPGAQHTPEALILLAKAYHRTGSPDLARDTLEVLALNYPGTAQKLGSPGQVSQEDRKGWFANLKDLADTVLERLRIKARY